MFLNGFVDVEKVAATDKFFEYNPEIYAGLIYFLKKPRISFLVFSNGKVVCTGGKNVKEVQRGVEKLCRRLKQTGTKFGPVSEIRVRNVVATADVHRVIDIELMATKVGNALYEPEQFPALICRLGKGKLVALLFSSGKMVLTGAKTVGELESAFKEIREMILSFTT